MVGQEFVETRKDLIKKVAFGGAWSSSLVLS